MMYLRLLTTLIVATQAQDPSCTTAADCENQKAFYGPGYYCGSNSQCTNACSTPSDCKGSASSYICADGGTYGCEISCSINADCTGTQFCSQFNTCREPCTDAGCTFKKGAQLPQVSCNEITGYCQEFPNCVNTPSVCSHPGRICNATADNNEGNCAWVVCSQHSDCTGSGYSDLLYCDSAHCMPDCNTQWATFCQDTYTTLQYCEANGLCSLSECTNDQDCVNKYGARSYCNVTLAPHEFCEPPPPSTSPTNNPSGSPSKTQTKSPAVSPVAGGTNDQGNKSVQRWNVFGIFVVVSWTVLSMKFT